MTDDLLSRLRVLAKAATPGDWVAYGNSVFAQRVGQRAGISICVVSKGNRYCPEKLSAADNVRFIAALDPQTVLALLDRIAALERKP